MEIPSNPIFNTDNQQSDWLSHLSQSKIESENVLRYCPIPTMIVSNQGIINLFNKAAEQLTGYDNRQMRSMTEWIQRLFPNDDDRAEAINLLNHKFYKNVNDHFQNRIFCKDGCQKKLDVYINHLKNYYIVQFIDITPYSVVNEKLQRAKNKLETHVQRGTSDLKKVNHTLYEEINDRKHIEQIVIKEKTFSEAIINSLPGIFLLFDSQNHLIRWNRNVQLITKYKEEELSQMIPSDFVTKQERRKIKNKINKVYEKGNLAVETQFQFKNKKTAPYYMNFLHMKMGKSSYLVSVGIDISEQKKLEAHIKTNLKEKEVLIKEIHHRVKNNLQVISSLINLQTQHTKNKHTITLFTETQNRIRSMALIHERLYNSETMSEIDFNDYMKRFTKHMLSTYDVQPNQIKLALKLNNIILDINTAIPCGLIVNELISNAIIHAFPGRKDNTITIELKKLSNGKVQICITDNGVGFPEDLDFRSTKTLGLKLVTTLIKQIEGHIHLERHEGTRFEITFK